MHMALEDKARNASQRARGKTKSAVGRATDDRTLETEGMIDEVVGHLKQAGESVKDAVRSTKPSEK
jgi:uncharacterized protein YjbJ (UPF0337 family)